jgi:hypothetical protein
MSRILLCCPADAILNIKERKRKEKKGAKKAQVNPSRDYPVRGADPIPWFVQKSGREKGEKKR